MKRITAVLAVLLFSAPLFAQVPPAQTVPDFTFYKLDNTAFTKKNLEPGKMLFFIFFDVSCEHCQHAITTLNQHYTEYKKAAIYLITLDSRERMTAFLNKYAPNVKGQKNVTLLQDLKNLFIVKFLPRKYPSMFLYSPEKKLLHYDDDEKNMLLFSKQLNAPVKKT